MTAALPTDPAFARQHLMQRIRLEDRGHSSRCWIWTGPKNHAGYGRTCVPGLGKSVRIHRATYTLFVGEIPAGKHLDHLCRVRECCNPTHLEPVTREENMRRAGRLFVRLPECSQGHPYTPENTHTDRRGKRTCRICRRRWWREGEARRKNLKVLHSSSVTERGQHDHV